MNKKVFFRLIPISAILFIFLFDGCAALKKRNHEPEVLDVAAITPAIDSALKTPDFIGGNWPAFNWWIVFEDEQLSEMMEVAIENNPDLMAAVSRVYAANEVAKKTRAPLLPNLSGTFKDNYQHLSKDDLLRFPPSALPAVVNQIHLTLNFEYEIDLFGKNRNLYRSSIGQARAQAAEMSQSLLMITVGLAQSYINYGTYLLNLQISDDLIASRKLYLELIERRFENGIENRLAVENAKALLLQEEENRTLYEIELALSKTALKVLMGLSPDDEKEIQPPSLSFEKPFPLPEDIPLNLLSRRPDLMAQIWQVESAAYLIKAAKAAFFPNINLKAFAGLETLKWNTLFSVESFAGSISPAISLPIFTGGKLTAELNEQYASYDTAVHDYNALLLRAAKEVMDQIKVLELKTEENRLETETFNRILHISELTDARYENGIDNYLSVLEAQINLMNEASKKITIQNERYLSMVALIKALGGGYEPIPLL